MVEQAHGALPAPPLQVLIVEYDSEPRDLVGLAPPARPPSVYLTT
jgi:hypothetical protein